MVGDIQERWLVKVKGMVGGIQVGGRVGGIQVGGMVVYR